MANEEKGFQKNSINWYPGHMAKTKRLIKENINMIDIIYELVDARIPYSSKIQDMEDILSMRPRLLIMTKSDLCDMKETKKWISYYESLGYQVVLADLTGKLPMKEIMDKTHLLLSGWSEKREQKGLKKRKIRALVVGVPNVGKSTFINRFVGKKAVNVGNKPGVTKTLDWIRMNDEVELLDSPGILWPKFTDQTIALNLAGLTAIKEEVLPIYEVICHILLSLYHYYPDLLKERYGIEEIDEEDDLVPVLDLIGKRRGCMMRGGEIDYDRVMALILQDVKDGKIKGITFDRYVDKTRNTQ